MAEYIAARTPHGQWTRGRRNEGESGFAFWRLGYPEKQKDSREVNYVYYQHYDGNFQLAMGLASARFNGGCGRYFVSEVQPKNMLL